jgi:hypothetical protein
MSFEFTKMPPNVDIARVILIAYEFRIKDRLMIIEKQTKYNNLIYVLLMVIFLSFMNVAISFFHKSLQRFFLFSKRHL